MSDSAQPHTRQPTRLPCPWDSPGKNTGVGCHFLLQRIFPTQGLNPGLLYCRQTLYHLSHQGSPSICLATAKSLQSCPTLRNPIHGSPPGSPVPGILQARILVGGHFLLQCMKVKSESEVAQSYPTLSDLMDCSLPGSSVHGIFQVLGHFKM